MTFAIIARHRPAARELGRSRATTTNAAVTVLSAVIPWTAVLRINTFPRPEARSVAALVFFLVWRTDAKVLSGSATGAP